MHEIWDIFRDFAAGAPDAVSLIFGVDRAGPDEGYPDDVVGRPIVYIAWNHSGAADDAERDTAALRVGAEAAHDNDREHPVPRGPDRPRPRLRLGQPLVHHEPQRERHPTGSARRGRRRRARPPRRDSTFSITALGGAIGRVPEDATAYAGRAAAFDLSADSAWTDPSLDEANREWARG